MNMTKITVSVGRTYNIGNFESLRIDVGVEMALDVLDTEPAQAVHKLRKWALERCNEEARIALKHIRE